MLQCTWGNVAAKPQLEEFTWNFVASMCSLISHGNILWAIIKLTPWSQQYHEEEPNINSLKSITRMVFVTALLLM